MVVGLGVSNAWRSGELLGRRARITLANSVIAKNRLRAGVGLGYQTKFCQGRFHRIDGQWRIKMLPGRSIARALDQLSRGEEGLGCHRIAVRLRVLTNADMGECWIHHVAEVPVGFPPANEVLHSNIGVVVPTDIFTRGTDGYSGCCKFARTSGCLVD